MAFVKKTWKDRDSEYPNRRIIDEGNVQKAVTVSRFEGVIYEEGDAFNAANMNDLEDRISAIESAQYEASGNIASFDCLSPSNLIGCVCNINPIQSGSGDPSPDNVRPIVGYTEVNLVRAGYNLLPRFNEAVTTINGITFTVNSNGTVLATGTPTARANLISYNFPSLPVGDYIISAGVSISLNYMLEVAVTRADGHTDYYNTRSTGNAHFIINKGDKITSVYISIFEYAGSINLTFKPMINKGSVSTDYSAYVGDVFEVEFKQNGDSITVYGGTLDVTNGILTVEWVKIVGLAGRYNSFANGTYSTFYRISLPELSTSGAISLKRGAISNCKVEETAYFGSNRTAQIESQKDIFAITTGGELLAIYDKDNTLTRTQFEEKYADFEACYPLATPQIYQLTPHQIQTILGRNNISHDGNGEISVTYIDAIKNGRLPLPPTTDGNYVLKLTVSGGIPAYTWQSAT